MSRTCWLVALLQSCLLQGCLIERLSLQPSDAAVDTRTDAFGDVDAFRALDAFSDIDAASDAFVVAPDAFVVVPDAFVVVPDAFVPVPDAFVPVPDAFDCARVTEACNAIDDDCDTRVDEGACVVGGMTCRSSVFGTRVYLVCPVSQTWNAARASCAALGSEYGFAVLRDSELSDVNTLGDVTGMSGNRTWVGLTDDGGRVAGASEATWYWTDGALESRFTRRTDDEDCGAIFGDGFFGDRPCESLHWFLCEAPVRPR
jgi:hypothetical protein